MEIVDGVPRKFTFSAATTREVLRRRWCNDVSDQDYVNTLPIQLLGRRLAIGDVWVIDPATPVNVNCMSTQVVLTYACSDGSVICS